MPRIRFARILCPIDFSPRSKPAFEQACAIEFAGEPIDVLTIPWIAAPGSFEQTTQPVEIVFGDEDVAHSHVQLRSLAGPPRIDQAPGDKCGQRFPPVRTSAR